MKILSLILLTAMVFSSSCIHISQNVYVNDRDIKAEDKQVEETDIETDVAEMIQKKESNLNPPGNVKFK